MNKTNSMNVGRAGLHRWIYFLTAGFLFAACVLRSLLILDGAVLDRTLILLAAWLVFFVLEPPLSRAWGGWFTLYLVLQCVLIVLLLLQSEATDFFGILFGLPWNPRATSSPRSSSCSPTRELSCSPGGCALSR